MCVYINIHISLYVSIYISNLQWLHMGPEMTWRKPTHSRRYWFPAVWTTCRHGASWVLFQCTQSLCRCISIMGLMLIYKKASRWTSLHCMQRYRHIQVRSSAASAVIAQSSGCNWVSSCTASKRGSTEVKQLQTHLCQKCRN